MNYTIRSFVWSKEQYTLREVLENFKSNLPFLVLVAQGYLGRDEHLHTISADEIYWLHRVESQTRVVVQSRGRYVSIPKDLAAKVHGYNSWGSETRNISIDEMLASSCSAFRFVNEEHLELFDGAGDGSETKLGKMTVEDIYEEPYIVAHSLIQGTLWEGEVTIPSYMHITLSLVDGLVGGTSSDLAKTVFDFTKLANSFNHERAITCKEILLFEGKPNEGDYAYWAPKMFISQIQKASRRYEEDASLMIEKQACVPTKDDTIKEAHNALPLPPRVQRKPQGDDVRVTPQRTLLTQQTDTPAEDDYDIVCVRACTGGEKSPCPTVEVEFASDFLRELDMGLNKLRKERESGQLAANGSTPDQNYWTQTNDDDGHSIVKPLESEEAATLASGEDDDPSQSLLQYGWMHQKDSQDVPKQTPRVAASKSAAVGDWNTDTNPDAPLHLVSIDSIPVDLTPLTVDEVCQCLALLHMSDSVETFREEMVDGELLCSMDEQQLQQGFNLRLLHARKLVKFVRGWRPKTEPMTKY